MIGTFARVEGAELADAPSIRLNNGTISPIPAISATSASSPNTTRPVRAKGRSLKNRQKGIFFARTPSSGPRLNCLPDIMLEQFAQLLHMTEAESAQFLFPSYYERKD